MENWNQQVQKSFNKATKGNFHQLKNLKDNVWFINEVLIKRLRDESLLTTDGTFVWFQDLKIFNTIKNDFEKPTKSDRGFKMINFELRCFQCQATTKWYHDNLNCVSGYENIFEGEKGKKLDEKPFLQLEIYNGDEIKVKCNQCNSYIITDYKAEV